MFFSILTYIARGDVITLQNPHGMPTASVPSAVANEKVKKTEQTSNTAPVPAVKALKMKESVPCTPFITSVLSTIKRMLFFQGTYLHIQAAWRVHL